MITKSVNPGPSGNDEGTFLNYRGAFHIDDLPHRDFFGKNSGRFRAYNCMPVPLTLKAPVKVTVAKTTTNT